MQEHEPPRNKSVKLVFLTLLVFGLGAIVHAANNRAQSAYWRFEGGQSGEAVLSALDASGKIEALAKGQPPLASDEVPLAIVPATGAANHHSLSFKGGQLRVHFPAVDQEGVFTVELWARFGPPHNTAQVLVSQGDGSAGKGNWHLIYHTNGTVQAKLWIGNLKAAARRRRCGSITSNGRRP